MRTIVLLFFLMISTACFSQNDKGVPAVPAAPGSTDEAQKKFDPLSLEYLAFREYYDLESRAEYKGGWHIFRKRVQNYLERRIFPSMRMKRESTVSFVIEKDGSLSNIRAVGGDAQLNKNLEKAVRHFKGGFQPAKKGILPVESELKFSFSL